jgi:hypothetical protein
VREPTDSIRPIITLAQGLALTVAVAVTLAAGIYPEPFLRLASRSLLFPFGH